MVIDQFRWVQLQTLSHPLRKGMEIKQTTRLLKAVAEENRLKILYLLQNGSLCVCEILEGLDLPQNLTSHHLSILKKGGLVTDEKKGRRVNYSLTPQGREVAESISKLANKRR